jgi:hypothetical protein
LCLSFLKAHNLAHVIIQSLKTVLWNILLSYILYFLHCWNWT